MPKPRSSYQLFALEQLGRVRPVQARPMFGGITISAGGLTFALLDDDTLYFKVNDANRPDFEAAGLGPFRPFGADGPAMQYYEVAAELLEDPAQLAPWVEKALDAAREAKRPRRKAGAAAVKAGRKPGAKAAQPGGKRKSPARQAKTEARNKAGKKATKKSAARKPSKRDR